MTNEKKLVPTSLQMKQLFDLIETGAITKREIEALLEQNDVWEGRILSIDRTRPFDLVNFYSDNHLIARQIIIKRNLKRGWNYTKTADLFWVCCQKATGFFSSPQENYGK